VIVVVPPSDDADPVIVCDVPCDGRIVQDSTVVVLERTGIDRRLDGSPEVNFCQNGKQLVRAVTPILRHGRIGEVNDRTARSMSAIGIVCTTTPRGHTRPTNVDGGARRIDVGTESLGRIGRTGHVRRTGLVRDVPHPMDEVVRTEGRSAMTRPHGGWVTTTVTTPATATTTIQQELYGQIDIDAPTVP
jgi:hypothetical protein